MTNAKSNLEALVAQLLSDEYQRLIGWMQSKMSNMTRDAAEDAVAFAFGQLGLGLMSEGHPYPVAWLRRVAYNEALSMIEREGLNVEVQLPDDAFRAVDQNGDPLDLAIRAEKLGLMDQLTDNERDALELQAEGLSYDEMMELRGWSKRQVGRYIYEGRQKLRRLADELGGDS